MVDTRDIEQTVTFNASPHEVYESLMDPARHSRFTQAEANVSREVGGHFTAYGGALSGTNLELVPDKRIVQAWRADDEGWPRDHYSTATFSFEQLGSGTRLHFTQTGVPEACYEDIAQGWQQCYWSPMKEFLET